MAGFKVYFVDNDMFVRGEGLNVKTVELNGSAVTTAAIERAGVAIAEHNPTPITLAYLGSGGDFEGVFSDVLTVVKDEENMTCHVVADDGADRHGDWKLPIKIQDRESA